MTSRNQYYSDWDYQDAINPDAARFREFIDREGALKGLLRDNMDRVNEDCWEFFPAETLAICKAFRSSGYRPVGLYGWNLILDESDDEDDDIPYLDSSPVLELVLFGSQHYMPSDLKQQCSDYCAKVLAAAAEWVWIFEKFTETETGKD